LDNQFLLDIRLQKREHKSNESEFFFMGTKQIDEKYPPRDVQLYMPWFERMQQDF
jgi:hypothetical protein